MSAPVLEPDWIPPLPTASGLERALACRASLRLPATYAENAAAARGTAMHAFLEAVSNGTERETALALVPPQWRKDAEALDLDALPLGAQYLTEVTLAWDWETDEARVLGQGLNRDYGAARPTEYVGTVDVLAVLPDRVWLSDFKSARNGKTPAARNAQLGMLALAACRAYERDAADVSLTFLDGTAPDGAHLDALDLDLFADTLRGLALYLESDAQDAPRMGAWCRYCPALASCPAQRSALSLLERGVSLAEQMTPEIAAEAWHRLEAIKGAIGMIEGAVWAYAAQTPVPLGDGMVLREVETSRESLDGEKVAEALKEYGGEDFARAAVSLEATKASVKRAVKAHAPKGKAASMEREVLAMLRERGAVGRSVSVTVKAVKDGVAALEE